MYEKKEGSSTIFHLLEAFLLSCRLPGIFVQTDINRATKRKFLEVVFNSADIRYIRTLIFFAGG